MSTWSRRAFLTVVLFVALFGAAAEADVSDPQPEEALPTGQLLLQQQDIVKREAELKAREDRMGIWEEDLTRRARGEQYFSDLEGYVTTGELVRAVLFTAVLSAALAVGVLLVAVRRGLVHGRSQTADELRHLEDRVRTGLREFDGLLTRLYDRILTDVSNSECASDGERNRGSESRGDAKVSAKSETKSDAKPRDPKIEPRAAGTNGHGTGGMRQSVLTLARDGIEAHEIGRRLQLGPGEVNFILRMETGR